jgi:WhiB family redox-sensing transcriptional regulator
VSTERHARLLPEIRRPLWQALAACRGAGPDAFFPAPGNQGRKDLPCKDCPVARACLDYAIEHRIEHGTWGGLSERARRKIQGRPRGRTA